MDNENNKIFTERVEKTGDNNGCSYNKQYEDIRELADYLNKHLEMMDVNKRFTIEVIKKKIESEDEKKFYNNLSKYRNYLTYVKNLYIIECNKYDMTSFDNPLLKIYSEEEERERMLKRISDDCDGFSYFDIRDSKYRKMSKNCENILDSMNFEEEWKKYEPTVSKWFLEKLLIKQNT